MQLLPHDRLEDILQRLGVTQQASEYHGALCGMLCHGDFQSESLIFDEMKDDAEALKQLMTFTAAVLGELETPEFIPCLPDDDEPLSSRVEALATWCAGFLYGLGTSQSLDMRTLTEESQELVRDFTEISRAAMAESEKGESEEDERAYTELVEYIRVGVQVIFLEMQPSRDSTPKDAKGETLH